MIGDDVVVTVLAISGKQVRLGFNAPKDVEIWREELYNKGIDSTKNKKGNHE